MRDKEEFVKLCNLIYVGKEGFTFPFEAIRHYEDYQDIYKSDRWIFLKEKMSKLLILVNSDNSLVGKDIETELWEMI
jgi:hypothetical protein